MKARARIAAVLLLLLTSVGPLAAEPVRLVRLWSGYRDAKSFVRISEYLHGSESHGGAIVLRSRPDSRDGFYYTMRLATKGEATVPDGRVILQVIAPDAEKPRRFEFPFQAGGRRSVRLELGLTGEDWTYGKKLPLAWKLEVFADDGTLLAERASFLWEKP